MEYKGIEIEVNSEGKFSAYMGEGYKDKITTETFKEIKRKINSILKPKARVKAFLIDRWGRAWEEPEMPKEVEITSFAEGEYFWVVSTEDKKRRKVCARELFKHSPEIMEKIFEANKTINGKLAEIEKLQDENALNSEEILSALKGGC